MMIIEVFSFYFCFIFTSSINLIICIVTVWATMSSFARQDADASDASAHSSSSSLLDNTANMIPSMCFAVNILERRIEVVPVEEEARNSTLLFFESIPHRQYLMLGHRIPDDEVDEEKDNYVHCEQCDSFYTYSCLIHPLYRVLDRSDSGYEETLNRAQRTLPAFLCITMSSIPDAGKGVFTKVDIPVGAVFGPYQGILRCEQKKADSDGYSWEIKRDHETVRFSLLFLNFLKFLWNLSENFSCIHVAFVVPWKWVKTLIFKSIIISDFYGYFRVVLFFLWQ